MDAGETTDDVRGAMDDADAELAVVNLRQTIPDRMSPSPQTLPAAMSAQKSPNDASPQTLPDDVLGQTPSDVVSGLALLADAALARMSPDASLF